MSTIRKDIVMSINEKYFRMHKNKIRHASNGKWYTYVPDEMAKDKRRLLKRNTEEALQEAAVFRMGRHIHFLKNGRIKSLDVKRCKSKL